MDKSTPKGRFAVGDVVAVEVGARVEALLASKDENPTSREEVGDWTMSWSMTLKIVVGKLSSSSQSETFLDWTLGVTHGGIMPNGLIIVSLNSSHNGLAL